MSEVFWLLFIGTDWSTDSGVLGDAMCLMKTKSKKEKEKRKNQPTIKTLLFLFKKQKNPTMVVYAVI